MEPKTLYVSDLDGTLLRPDERISPFSCAVINRLVENGMLFSYATARSFHTAKKCAAGLTAKIPLIVYNGALILDNVTGEILYKNVFTQQEAAGIYALLRAHEISPIVYALIGGAEKFSYDEPHIPACTRDFVLSRKGDARDRPLPDETGILTGEVYYFTCIDSPDTLFPAYEALQRDFAGNCSLVCQKDIYSGEQWLEIMPAAATKASAIRRLKQFTGAEKVVVFGDGKNDIPMFLEADEGYAVANADPSLKAIATAVIEANTEDAVAKWLAGVFLRKINGKTDRTNLRTTFPAGQKTFEDC